MLAARSEQFSWLIPASSAVAEHLSRYSVSVRSKLADLGHDWASFGQMLPTSGPIRPAFVDLGQFDQLADQLGRQLEDPVVGLQRPRLRPGRRNRNASAAGDRSCTRGRRRFFSWPDEALYAVSESVLSQAPLMRARTRQHVLCVQLRMQARWRICARTRCSG